MMELYVISIALTILILLLYSFMKERKESTLILKSLIIPGITSIATAVMAFNREITNKNGSLLDAIGFFFLTFIGIILSVIIGLGVLAIIIRIFHPSLLNNTNRKPENDLNKNQNSIEPIIVKERIQNNTNENKHIKESNNYQKENVIEKEIAINLNDKKNEPIIKQTVTPYIEEEIQIKIIKSIPDPEKSEPKRIGYLPNNIFSQIEPYKYAVVKMPQENSIIKFPRKGRSDKKGYKEDDFMIYLNKYFKSNFNVFNDRHIPTQNSRPYEPDFVLSNEVDNKNIFINIEIDEPYEALMRAPTHCIDENNTRDDFFTKRGWIVIRFAEIQVHLEPQKCCAFIAKVISSIDKTFSSDLINEANPSSINQWDSLQAKKWAIEKYREKYLGIQSFGKRPNVITEYEITESESDIAVEKEIPKTFINFATENGKLAKINEHARDKRISFDPVEHRYFIDGNADTISVTQLIDKFFPEFDAPYWAQIKATERGISPEAILMEWEVKRVDAAKRGTSLHEEIEKYYNNLNHNSDTIEFQHFLAFNQRYNSIKPYRTEWRIFDEDLLVAGTIDMTYEKEKDILYIFDWKRSEKVVRKDGTIKNETYKFAFGELEHLGDNSFNKYCLQQNIYKAILEKRYNKKISSMNLLIMHESYDRYHSIPIPDMQKEVNYIFSYLMQTK